MAAVTNQRVGPSLMRRCASFAAVSARATWAIGGLLTSGTRGARLLRKTVPAALFVLNLIGLSLSRPLLTGTRLAFVTATGIALFCNLLLAGFIVWIASMIDHDEIEQRKIEEAQQLSSEQLSLIVGFSDDAIITKTLDGTITAWNRGAEKVFGYSAAEMVGKPMLVLLPPERVNEESDILNRIGHGDNVDHFETVRLKKDGTSIHVSVTISPIRNSNGIIVGASKIARDITQRKQAEDALREKERRLSESQRIAHIGSWSFDLKDPSARLVWSDELYRLYGVSPETFLPTMESLLSLIVSEDRSLVRDWMTACAAGEKPANMDFHVMLPDGAVRVFSRRGELQCDADNSPIRLVGTTQDITDFKRTEERMAAQAEELRRSQQALETKTFMLQHVLDSMVEGLVAADENGKYILWNPAAEKLIGLGATDLSPQEWSAHYGFFLPDQVTPVPPGETPLGRTLRGETVSTEMFMRRPGLDGELWLEANGSPLIDKDGVRRGGVLAFRDITRRKTDELEIRKLNEELEEKIAKRTRELAATNRELEGFSYSISHDLRAPLRHIAGFSRILVNDFGPTLAVEAREHLQHIENAVHRMGLLVDGLLKMAVLRRQALRLHHTELNPIVDDVVSMLQPECEGRDVEWRIARLPALDCDPILMAQVFQNLLSNAVKYSRGRASSVIEIDSIQRPGLPAIIFVRDNGAGFDMRYARKLFGVFQRFHTTSEFEGTGVGLATVHRIIQKHGGMIWAETEVDQGATFYFALQATEQIVATPKAAAPS
jgi:PAS domain S-box-containing protein